MTFNFNSFRLFSRFFFIAILLASAPAFSAIDEYEFSSDNEQARFKKLTAEMRCPKCLNANLSGSDAPIAADLRGVIYDQIKDGRSDEEIIEFMRIRYGDFILYRPPLTRSTFFLWFGPGLLLIAGFVILRRMMVNSRKNISGELSEEESKQLAKILKQDGKQ